MKSVFDGRNDKDATCPQCERPVAFYSYAFSATHTNVSSLQERLSSLDTEVSDLKNSLVAANAEANEAISRLNEWRLWGIVAKGKMSSMPPSGFPHVHVVVSPEPGSEAARSRSPRQTARLARIV
jgi:hypothetical protein